MVIGGALLLVLGLPQTAGGQEPGGRCRHPDGWDFACGYVALYVEPAADAQSIVAACDPQPGEMTYVGSDAANGTLIYRLSVPVGSELQLAQCYETQPGTDSAELFGFGEVSPDTAMPRQWDPASTAGTLLLIVGVMGGAAWVLGHRYEEVREPPA